MKIAVITGASSGIGRDFALQLDKKYTFDEMWLIARRRDKLESLASELKNKARILCLDLTKQQSIDEYEKALKENGATVEFLVNSSGYGVFGKNDDIPLEEQLGIIELNVVSLVKLTYITKRFMQSGSKIIQLGSASTYHPLPNFSIYSSSKAFVKHYSRALSKEWKKEGITVTCVCPGWVRTEFFDRANIDTDPTKTFAKPSVCSKDVVKKAIKDAEKGRDISMFGLYNNFHHFLSKILPHSLMMRIWLGTIKNAVK